MTPVTPPAPVTRDTPFPGARSALVLLLLINLFNYIDRQVLAAVVGPIKKSFFGASGISQGAKHPTGQGDLDGGILGVVMKSAAMESRRDTYAPSYQPGDPVNIKRAGRLWTATESGCAVHDPVYVRTVANSGNGCTQLGAFANQADGSDNINLTGAGLPIRWITPQATPGGPAAIDFNIIGQ